MNRGSKLAVVLALGGTLLLPAVPATAEERAPGTPYVCSVQKDRR